MSIFSPKIALAASLMLGALTLGASSASAMPAVDPSIAVVAGAAGNIEQVSWRRHYGYHYYHPYIGTIIIVRIIGTIFIIAATGNNLLGARRRRPVCLGIRARLNCGRALFSVALLAPPTFSAINSTPAGTSLLLCGFHQA